MDSSKDSSSSSLRDFVVDMEEDLSLSVQHSPPAHTNLLPQTATAAAIHDSGTNSESPLPSHIGVYHILGDMFNGINLSHAL